MSKPLQGGIARLVAKGLKQAKLSKPVTLTRLTPGTRGATVTAGTNPTSTTYAARGFIEDYGPEMIDGTLITLADRQLSVIGASIAGGQVPRPSDRLTIDGITYTVVRVQDDPAGAMYICHVRGLAA